MKTYKITGTKTTFLVTYKATGQLKKVEYKSGHNNPDVWKNLIFSLPQTEIQLSAFREKYANTIRVEEMGKRNPQPASLYKHYVDAWFILYHSINAINPKFGKIDGQAIKGIQHHLEKESNTPQDALASWQAILQNWHTLPEYYRKKTDLAFINAKLNEILTHLKDTTNGKAQADTFRQGSK